MIHYNDHPDNSYPWRRFFLNAPSVSALGAFVLGAILLACAETPPGEARLEAAGEAVAETAGRPGPGITRIQADAPSEDAPGVLEGALRFIPEALPDLTIPPGVGIVAREGGRGAALSRDEGESLTGSFKAAYREGLLRALPLRGTLGGDQVHGWPPAAPLSWVQNWRTAAPQSSSWGLPGLILALRGFDSPRVYIVSGPILDFYGHSGGINGANGAAGYGPPRGNAFYFEGGLAQKFARGFIQVDREGKAAFIPAEDGGTEAPEQPRPHALLRAESRAAAPPGPAVPERYLDFGAAPWPLDFAGTTVSVGGIFLRFFEEAYQAEIRLDAPELSLPAVILRGPFLEALLGSDRARLPGAEALNPNEFSPPQGLDPTTRALLQGMALYGLPLTGEMPLERPPVDEPPVNAPPAGGPSGGEAPAHDPPVLEPMVFEPMVRAQRFSRGWLILEAEGSP
jgi:hypothetical protein